MANGFKGKSFITQIQFGLMVYAAIALARQIRTSTQRPPVTENERLCTRCSLSPVCLPEEARLVHNKEYEP